MKTFQLVEDHTIAIIEINTPEKSVNTFTQAALQELADIFVTIEQKKFQGIVVLSTKPNNFAAGVDIGIFDTFHQALDAQRASSTLQRLFDNFSKYPSVAAIHGTCLGGGFELALACQYRIATAESSFALPEVKLGLLPGGGGTTRLPRLIGLVDALDLMLTGKQIKANKAFKLGLIDEICSQMELRKYSVKLCQKLTTRKEKIFQLPKIFAKTPIGRAFIGQKAKKTILQTTQGFYPAPFEILARATEGLGMPLEKALEEEAKGFGKLVVTAESQALRYLFSSVIALKKNPFSENAAAVQEKITQLKNGQESIAILGGGLMGAGIASVLIGKGIRCQILENNSAAIIRAQKSIQKYFAENLSKKRISKNEYIAALGRLSFTTELKDLRNCFMIIEAVFENLEVKQKLIADLELIDPKFTVFASNTSSIPIVQIAEKSKQPEKFVGMHFFSPVPKMPLVELITAPKTSQFAAAFTFEVATLMNKNIICVQDKSPGFYTTRILACYLLEALQILNQGAGVVEVDRALLDFGMPIGPFSLMDEVGLDVGFHILKIMGAADKRFVEVQKMSEIVNPKTLGKKTERGFYHYENGKRTVPNSNVVNQLQGKAAKNFTSEEIAKRCMHVFKMECQACVDAGIVPDTLSANIGAIFGLGYPPFLGGPLFTPKKMS